MFLDVSRIKFDPHSDRFFQTVEPQGGRWTHERLVRKANFLGNRPALSTGFLEALGRNPAPRPAELRLDEPWTESPESITRKPGLQLGGAGTDFLYNAPPGKPSQTVVSKSACKPMLPSANRSPKAPSWSSSNERSPGRLAAGKLVLPLRGRATAGISDGT
jgi:hypothetical protein